MVEETADDLHGFLRFIGIVAVGIGTFLITLDQFIVNVSISTIAGELGVSDNNGAWSITAYTTASAFAIPLTGWLTKRLGRVRLFVLAALFFSLFSFLCGTAQSLMQLVLFRVLQGMAGGPLIPLSQALLLFLMARNKSMAMGVFGMLVMIGPVAGPILGGWITFDYGWRPIFYVNVPIGIAVAITVGAILSRYESQTEKIKMDYGGLGLLFIWIAAYQVMMNKGYDWAWFESPKIRALGCIALITLVFFIIWEWFHDHAVVALKYFRNLNFSIALIIMTPIMAILFCNLVTGPIWVQQVLGYNQVWAGLTLAPLGVTAVLVFPLIGRFMDICDVRIWIFLALLTLGLSFFWISASPINVDFRTMAYQRMLMGVGFALIYPPLMTISITSIPPQEMPSAAGVFSFARMMGVGFGVAYGTNYYYTREVFFQKRYGSMVIPANEHFAPYVEILKEKLGLVGETIDAKIYEMVQHQAYTEAYLQMCYISGILCLVLMLLIPFVRKPQPAVV